MIGPKVTLTLQSSTETNTAFGVSTTWASEGNISGTLTKHSGVRLSYKEVERENKITEIQTLTFFCVSPGS